MSHKSVIYKYGTGNPVQPNGSIDVRDGIDNLQSFDIFMNADEDTYNQRDGGVVKTVHGMIGEFNQHISDQESEFNQHITGMAFTRVGTFESGTTLDDLREVLLWDVSDGGDGHEYGWTGSFPKVVAPNSTPSSSGGVGAGAWVDRTDVTLRSELISNNQIPVTVSQFGGNSGFANDSTVALIAFINAINSGAHEGSEFLIDGLYRTTQPLPAITKPVSMSGVTTANSAILFDNVNDGLSLDLSGTPSNTVQSAFSNFSILTNKTLAGTGFWYIPNSGSSQSVKLELNSMRVDSLDRFNNSSSTKEWLVGVRLGVDGGSFKPSEVRIDNLVLYGSDANGGYAGLTSAGSSGIVADGATNCIITRSKIFLLSGYGVLFRGQSEGTNIISSQVVAVRNGVGYTGVVNPSNNHSISNTHISPYERGIYIKAPTTDAGVSTPLANYFTSIFILERGDTADKNARFIGVDVAARFSKFANVTVWANAKAGGVHEKIGFRVANGGNILHNCHSHRMTYSMETFDAIAGFAHDVAVHDFHDEDSIIGLLSPASTKQVSGMVRSDSLAGRTWRRPVHFMNQFTAKHENGTEYFDVNGGVVTIKSPSGDTTNFRHVPNTSTDNTPGATIIGVGGTTVANQGNWILRAALTQFSGSQSPEVANTGTVGTPGRPFAGGFTQSAFTVTSDERYKSSPEEITDFMLDAAAEVEWCTFQYIDRVEEKGTDGARWHFGAIAQRFVEAFQKYGLDPYRFAFICYDKWAGSPEILGDDGEVISPAVDAGSRYGIRYDQAIILKQKQIERDHKRQIDALVTRIEALEHK